MVVCIREDSELLKLCLFNLNDESVGQNIKNIILKIYNFLQSLLKIRSKKIFYSTKINFNLDNLPSNIEFKTLIDYIKGYLFIEPYCEFLTCIFYNYKTYFIIDNNTFTQNIKFILYVKEIYDLVDEHFKSIDTNSFIKKYIIREEGLENLNMNLTHKKSASRKFGLNLMFLKYTYEIPSPAFKENRLSKKKDDNILKTIQFLKDFYTKLKLYIKNNINYNPNNCETKNNRIGCYRKKFEENCNKNTTINDKNKCKENRLKEYNDELKKRCLIKDFKYEFYNESCIEGLSSYHQPLRKKKCKNSSYYETLTDLINVLQKIEDLNKKKNINKKLNDNEIFLISLSMFEPLNILRFYYKLSDDDKENIIKILVEKNIKLYRENIVNNLFRFNFSYLSRHNSKTRYFFEKKYYKSNDILIKFIKLDKSIFNIMLDPKIIHNKASYFNEAKKYVSTNFIENYLNNKSLIGILNKLSYVTFLYSLNYGLMGAFKPFYEGIKKISNSKYNYTSSSRNKEIVSFANYLLGYLRKLYSNLIYDINDNDIISFLENYKYYINSLEKYQNCSKNSSKENNEKTNILNNNLLSKKTNITNVSVKKINSINKKKLKMN